MERHPELQKKLLTYIQDAFALENQVVEVLQNHAAQAMSFPEIQAKVREHIAESKVHRGRMEARLQAHGVSPSALKSAATTVIGNLIGAAGMLRTDVLAKNARDEYVTEHLEIAAYTLLIATARAAGDEETVRAAEANLRDEVEMQRWLLHHLPEIGLRALEGAGIVLPTEARHAAATTAAPEASTGVKTAQEQGGQPRDTVEEASDESFPASDPPAWT